MNDFYVYFHKRKDNGEIFYVGKGRKNRAYSNSNRSPSWFRVVEESNGYDVQLYRTDMDEDTALELESKLIFQMKEKLVNKVVSAKVIDFSKLNVREYLAYSEESPSCLIWKKSPSSKIIIGSTAGCLSKIGTSTEWQVRLQGRLLKGHRVVMYLHKDFDMKLVVNHINCDPKDNRISNLEVCTKSQNNQRQSCHKNIKVKKHNTSGVTGVREHIMQGKYLYASVEVKLNDVRYRKLFPYSKYGKELAWELAIEYRNSLT